MKIPVLFPSMVAMVLLISGCSLEDNGEKQAAVSRSVPETDGLITTQPDLPETLTFEMVERSEARYDIGFVADDIKTDFPTTEVKVSTEGTFLVVQTGDLEKEALGRIDLIKQGKVEAFVVIHVANNSSEHLLAKAKAMDAQSQNLLRLYEADKLFRYYVDVAYEGGQITRKEKAQMLERFSPGTADTFPSTATALNNVYATANAYRGGALTERDLEEAIKMAEDQLNEHAEYATRHFAKLKRVRPSTPDYSKLSFVFRTDTNAYRMFQGNPLFGSVGEQGAFAYHDEYSDLVGFIFYEQKDGFWAFLERFGL